MSHHEHDELEHGVHRNGDAVWADGVRTAAARPDDWTFILRFKERYGFRSVTEAMEAIAEVREETACEAGGQSADVDKARQFLERMKVGGAWVLNYKGDPNMKFRALLHLLGLHDVAGGGKGTAVEIARACSTSKHHVKKQTAHKCIRSLERVLNAMPQYGKLPPLPGQRGESARENMSRKMKESWRTRRGS